MKKLIVIVMISAALSAGDKKPKKPAYMDSCTYGKANYVQIGTTAEGDPIMAWRCPLPDGQQATEENTKKYEQRRDMLREKSGN